MTISGGFCSFEAVCAAAAHVGRGYERFTRWKRRSAGPARVDPTRAPPSSPYERERARLIARSSCAFVIVERPSIPSRFAWL